MMNRYILMAHVKIHHGNENRPLLVMNFKSKNLTNVFVFGSGLSGANSCDGVEENSVKMDNH